MLRERLRMGSRRGGSRGPATHQHSSTTSDAPSDALEFDRFNYPATRSGRGRGRERVRIEDWAHLGVPEDQRMADPNVNQCQVTGGLSAVNSEAIAGSSAPTRGEPSGSEVHPYHSNDSDQFGCQIVEEQPFTSDDE